MDFIDGALKALPGAVTHPFALISYLIVVLTWAVLAFRIQRFSKLMEHIESLPERERARALRNEMGVPNSEKGITGEQWLAQKRITYFFLALIASIVAAVVVFAITLQNAKLPESRSELVSILDDRASELLAKFDVLIADASTSKSAPFEKDQTEYFSHLKEELQKRRQQASELIKKTREALQNGDLVRAHELGNQINNLEVPVQDLVDKSNERVAVLGKAVAIRTLNKDDEKLALEIIREEAKRKEKLNDLSANARSMSMEPNLSK